MSSSPTTDEVDSVLAKELNLLSFRDRTRIQEEIHGVQFVSVEETPEKIETSLAELEQEIQKIRPKPAYDEAAAANSHWVLRDKSFRLQFLRADLFDAKRAAGRMVAHLELRRKFLGHYALHRPMRFSDLSESDVAALRSGSVQILPSRDRAGRLIKFSEPEGDADETSTISNIRRHLYQADILAEDIETQRKGYVLVFVARSDLRSLLSEEKDLRMFAGLVRAHSIRLSAIHIFLPTNQQALQFLRNILVFSLASSKERVRIRFYTGLSMENQYQLMSYGIPINDLPMSSSLTVKTKNHLQWVRTRIAFEKALEAGRDTSSWILQPGVHDILFSRGGNPQNQGNIDFRHMIEPKLDAYFSTSGRKIKKKLRDELIAEIESFNGRFLELDKEGGWWMEITNQDVLHEKINAAFYHQKKRVDARRNFQEIGSDTNKFLDGNKRQKLGRDGTFWCG